MLQNKDITKTQEIKTLFKDTYYRINKIGSKSSSSKFTTHF